MIRRKDYSDSSEVSSTSDTSTERSCYVCEKIRRDPRRHRPYREEDSEVIYVRQEENCELGPSILFSESTSTTGLRYMGVGSSGPNFTNGSVILPRDELITRMWVAVKDVSPTTVPVNIQCVLTYARADTSNDYSAGVVQTHLSAVVQIPVTGVLQTRAGSITVSPGIPLRASDLIGILINPTDLTVSFQATAGIA